MQKFSFDSSLLHLQSYYTTLDIHKNLSGIANYNKINICLIKNFANWIKRDRFERANGILGYSCRFFFKETGNNELRFRFVDE